MAKKKLEYKGELLTLQELSELSGLPAVTIYNRVRKGWSVETAVETPKFITKQPSSGVPEEFENGNIVQAIFTKPLPNVYQHMQPKLFKEYVVEARSCMRAAPSYFITLDSGKPLIVYPEEFQITRVIPPCQEEPLAASV